MALALALVVVGCDVALNPPTPAPTASPTASLAPATTTPQGSEPTSPRPSPTPGSTPTVVEGDLAGYWRVQESTDVAAPAELVGSLDRNAFAVYLIEPACASEPCDKIGVTVLLPTYGATVREHTLNRKGNRYEATNAAKASGPCLTPDGTTVPGGATVTERTSLWLERVSRTGTAVTTTELRGETVVTGEPTTTGKAAGCEAWKVQYRISGSPTGAPAGGGTDAPPTSAPTSADVVPRPDIRLTVKGATVDWFSIKGRTVRAMVESVAAGGVKACGRISYEWYQGDTRPSGCMETDWRTFNVSAVSQPGGSCRLDVSRIAARYVVHLPRWTSPTDVPRPLAKWWRATVTFIRDHEAGHVAIGLRWVKKLPALLDGKACSKLEAIMGKWAAGLQAAQEAYDSREYQATWPPAPPGY